MANRDLSNFRTVTQVEPKVSTTGQLLTMGGEMGQEIIKISEQSRIAKSLSDAQLEINKLDTDFRIKNESNPADAKAIEGYKAQRQSLLGKYRGGIASIFVNDFDNQAADLEANSDMQMQQWQYKQAQINIVTDIDEMAQNNKNLLATKAIEYAKTGEGDLDAILDFSESRNQMIQFGLDSGVIGQESINKVISGFDKEMGMAWLETLAIENPYVAKKQIQTGYFDKILDVEDRLKLDKTIDRKIKAANKAAINSAASNLESLSTDPYAFFAKKGLSFEGNINAQLESGMFDLESVQVMSQKEAKGFVSAIGNIKTPDEFTNFYSNLSAQYKEFTPNVIKSLSAAGLDNNAKLAFSMLQMPEYQQDGAAFDALFEMSQLRTPDGKKVSPEQAAKDILTSQGKDAKTVLDTAQTAALQGLNKWTTAQLDGNNDLSSIATVQQQVKDMAAFYVSKGFEPADAAEKATNWVTKGVEFISINNKNFMLPKTALADDTSDEIENRLLSLSESQISLPAQTVDNLTKKDYLEIIKSEGGWVNSRDGQNLVLVDDKGLLVFDPQGNEIKISITELEAKKNNLDFDNLSLEEKIEQFNILIDQYGNN